MLGDEERAELLAASRSASLREDFRALRRGSRPPADLDALLAFLTRVSRFAGPGGPREPAARYDRRLI